jgi:hypothetical protein
VTENELDSQMLAIFDTLRIEDAEFRDIFREQLRKATNWDERSSATRAKQLQDELVQVRDQQNRLLNLRMLEEINADTFALKSRDLRDREAELKLEIDVADRGRHEIIDIAAKAFELSQSLRDKWFTADYAAKRRILEIICLNCSLDGVSLVATMRKPFDLLAKGLVSRDSRVQGIGTTNCRDDLRCHRRLPHAATPQQITDRPPSNGCTWFPGQLCTNVLDLKRHLSQTACMRRELRRHIPCSRQCCEPDRAGRTYGN